MPYTDQELDDFILQDDLTFEDIDGKASIKTNIFLLVRNFLILPVYLSKLKAYLLRLNNLVKNDLGTLIINNLQVNKISIVISKIMNVGEIINYPPINGVTYKIERLDNFIVEISNVTDPLWITDNLIIQIKDDLGTIVYPTIITKENKIKLHFIDGLLRNYKVFII